MYRDDGLATARPDYFIVLDWAGDRVLAIRDFLYARYAIDDAEVRPL